MFCKKSLPKWVIPGYSPHYPFVHSFPSFQGSLLFKLKRPYKGSNWWWVPDHLSSIPFQRFAPKFCTWPRSASSTRRNWSLGRRRRAGRRWRSPKGRHRCPRSWRCSSRGRSRNRWETKLGTKQNDRIEEEAKAGESRKNRAQSKDRQVGRDPEWSESRIQTGLVRSEIKNWGGGKELKWMGQS